MTKKVQHRYRVAGMCLLSTMASAASFVSEPSTRRILNRPSTTTAHWAKNSPPLPNFCSDCGQAAMVLRIPESDERLRAVCKACGKIEYSNPKVVVSCVVLTDDDRCLLGKRAIEPRKGTWGIPQGYMEHGETSREAAVREVLEETGAVVPADHLRLRAVYNVPGSVQLVYEAQVAGAVLEQQIANATYESSQVSLFALDSIPFDELCFPTVQWALDHSFALRENRDSANGVLPVQQRSKLYNADIDQWSVLEDEMIP